MGLLVAVQLAQREVKGADGAAVLDRFFNELLHAHLVQGVDQRAGEVGAGVLDDLEQLDDGAVGFDQLQLLRRIDFAAHLFMDGRVDEL